MGTGSVDFGGAYCFFQARRMGFGFGWLPSLGGVALDSLTALQAGYGREFGNLGGAMCLNARSMSVLRR